VVKNSVARLLINYLFGLGTPLKNLHPMETAKNQKSLS